MSLQIHSLDIYQVFTLHYTRKICLYTSLSITILLLFMGRTFSQDVPCQSDEHRAYWIENDLDYLENLLDNEQLLQDMMTEHPMAIMNSTVYTIPVVFHVIHHANETLGQGSNVSDIRIYQALQDLNDYFRDVQNIGNDVEIEFCLAVRDPNGDATDGINRVNGDGVPYFSYYGLHMTKNEAEVKSLSRWPNDQYLNLWVVSDIYGNPNITTYGFATFPGANSLLDGVVLISDAVGLTENATIITHEVGHFLQLYHTFEGGNASTCPPNDFCHDQGDRCCMTAPQKLLNGECDEMEINDCTIEPLGDLVNNHMGYFPPSCHTLFKEDQIMRMRGALMSLRAGLITSRGCENACNDVIVDFSMSDVTVGVGASLTFTNLTSPSQASYLWKIEGGEFVSTNLTYPFHHIGPVLICLEGTFNGCTNEVCQLIEVVGVDDCSDPVFPNCNILSNGTFERNNVQIGISDHFSNDPDENINKVCNWINKWRTPFFCSNLGEDVFAILVASPMSDESVVSELEIPFEDGKNYKITFEYYTGNAYSSTILATDPTLIVGLSHTSDFGYHTDDVIIEELTDLWYDEYDVKNLHCLNSNDNFHYHEFTFNYSSTMGKHLYFRNIFTGMSAGDEYSIIFIRDIQVPTCFSCIPVPDFEFEVDDCSVAFEGESLGDDALWYNWDFGDGITSTQQNVTHNYLYPGKFNVCLTIACDPEIIATECKEIEIIDHCTDCTELPNAEAVICNFNENSANTYMAKFSAIIPNDYRVCPGNNLFIHSNDVVIEVTSYEIIDAALNHDLLKVSVVIEVPPGYNFNQTSATGNFILCDLQGEMFCYSIEFSGTECANCLELDTPSEATCNESLSDLNTFVYDGVVEIEFEQSGYIFDGFESSELGFEIISATSSGDFWTIQYRITVENLYFASTNIILRFHFEDIKWCVSSQIIITEPCAQLPVDCVEEWDEKTLDCSRERIDYFEFPFEMFVPNNGYSICEGGLFGTITGGGIVEILHAQIQGPNLDFSLNILMPSNYNDQNTYYLRLYLCNNRGEMVCYLFPFILECNLGSFQPLIQRGTTETGFESDVFSLFPNPAHTSITIQFPGFESSSKVDLDLVDLTGQTLYFERLTSSIIKFDVSTIASGVYFVRLKESGRLLSTKKVVLMQ